MEVIPSIDIRGGLCVRLHQGDYARETVYSDDPNGVGLRWRREGACRLHVVDLDGAAEGMPVNLQVISSLASRVGIPIQVGGGVRSFEAAQRLLDCGAGRVVLGTVAVQDPELVQRLVRVWGSNSVVVAVDARGGKVAIKGWREDTDVSAGELVRQMEEIGVSRFLYTDIARDGTLTSPNFDAIRDLSSQTVHPILASGGISSTEHVVRLATIGVEGAILGRALYTGDIELKSAIAAAKGA